MDRETPSPYRILIADDHGVVLEGVRSVLSAGAGLEVIGEATNGRDVMRLMKIERPDVLVLDITMPQGGGIELLAPLREQFPATKVVIHTVHDSAHYIHECLLGGVRGYVVKGDFQADLLKAVLSVLEGKLYLSPSIGQTVVNGYLAGTRAAAANSEFWETLTPREQDIIRLSAQGLRVKEIARRLALSPKTVENHRYRMMKKLNLRNVSALISYVLENGLVDETEP